VRLTGLYALERLADPAPAPGGALHRRRDPDDDRLRRSSRQRRFLV